MNDSYWMHFLKTDLRDDFSWNMSFIQFLVQERHIWRNEVIMLRRAKASWHIYKFWQFDWPWNWDKVKSFECGKGLWSLWYKVQWRLYYRAKKQRIQFLISYYYSYSFSCVEEKIYRFYSMNQHRLRILCVDTKSCFYIYIVQSVLF